MFDVNVYDDPRVADRVASFVVTCSLFVDAVEGLNVPVGMEVVPVAVACEIVANRIPDVEHAFGVVAGSGCDISRDAFDLIFDACRDASLFDGIDVADGASSKEPGTLAISLAADAMRHASGEKSGWRRPISAMVADMILIDTPAIALVQDPTEPAPVRSAPSPFI